MTSHPSAAPEDSFRLAQAERALDYQMASVDAAQGRAATLLAAIGLTASVLLPGAVERASGRAVELVIFIIGLLALVASAGLVGFAVWPRRYEVTVALPQIGTEGDMTRHLTATINTKMLLRNARAQEAVWRAVRLGLVTFAIHALSWGAIHLMEVSP